MAQKNVVSIAVESFKVSKETDGVKVVGIALPFNKISRNGFTYITESVVSAAPSLVKRPVLFNHNSEAVIGHVVMAPIGSAGMEYQMNINPNAVNPETGVAYAESIARGDLSNVSIQCTYDESRSTVDVEGVTHAYIDEFLELSIVTIPGFADTTAQVIESFKNKSKAGEKMTEEKTKVTESAPVASVEPSPTPAPVASESKVEAAPVKEEAPAPTPAQPTSTNQPAGSLADPMAVVMARVEKVEADLAVIKEQFGKWMQEEKEEPQHKDEDKSQAPDSDDEKDKKVEEAIRKDKVSVSSESLVAEKKEITQKDIKALFMSL